MNRQEFLNTIKKQKLYHLTYISALKEILSDYTLKSRKLNNNKEENHKQLPSNLDRIYLSIGIDNSKNYLQASHSYANLKDKLGIVRIEISTYYDEDKGEKYYNFFDTIPFNSIHFDEDEFLSFFKDKSKFVADFTYNFFLTKYNSKQFIEIKKDQFYQYLNHFWEHNIKEHGLNGQKISKNMPAYSRIVEMFFQEIRFTELLEYYESLPNSLTIENFIPLNHQQTSFSYIFLNKTGVTKTFINEDNDFKNEFSITIDLSS